MSINNVNDFTNFNFKGLANLLQSLSPLEFATLGSIVGAIISIPLNTYELNSIGNFLELVGQFILTVQAQVSYLAPKSPTKNELCELRNELDAKITYLLKMINNSHKS